MTIDFTRAEFGVLVEGLKDAETISRCNAAVTSVRDGTAQQFRAKAARYQVLIDRLELARAQAGEHDECDGTMEG